MREIYIRKDGDINSFDIFCLSKKQFTFSHIHTLFNKGLLCARYHAKLGLKMKTAKCLHSGKVGLTGESRGGNNGCYIV